MLRVFTKRLLHTSPALQSAHPVPAGSNSASLQRKLSINDIHKLYESQTPIAVLTAHDYLTARYADEAQADMILVGDSLAMVALGYEDTNEIPFDEFVYHCRAVSRGTKRSFIVADLTFGSYESSIQQAISSSIALIKNGRANAVKLEGGVEVSDTVRKLTELGIPVMGHVGLTPQRANALGGFKVQGKSVRDAIKILKDAKAIEAAGAFAIVMEAIPTPIASIISSKLSIPTIGIGAGGGTSGQVLVQADMLGMTIDRVPKFVKTYGNIFEGCVTGASRYVEEVKRREFPGVGNRYEYKVKDEIVDEFQKAVESIE